MKKKFLMGICLTCICCCSCSHNIDYSANYINVINGVSAIELNLNIKNTPIEEPALLYSGNVYLPLKSLVNYSWTSSDGLITKYVDNVDVQIVSAPVKCLNLSYHILQRNSQDFIIDDSEYHIIVPDKLSKLTNTYKFKGTMDTLTEQLSNVANIVSNFSNTSKLIIYKNNDFYIDSDILSNYNNVEDFLEVEDLKTNTVSLTGESNDKSLNYSEDKQISDNDLLINFSLINCQFYISKSASQTDYLYQIKSLKDSIQTYKTLDVVTKQKVINKYIMQCLKLDPSLDPYSVNTDTSDCNQLVQDAYNVEIGYAQNLVNFLGSSKNIDSSELKEALIEIAASKWLDTIDSDIIAEMLYTDSTALNLNNDTPITSIEDGYKQIYEAYKNETLNVTNTYKKAVLNLVNPTESKSYRESFEDAFIYYLQNNINIDSEETNTNIVKTRI